MTLSASLQSLDVEIAQPEDSSGWDGSSRENLPAGVFRHSMHSRTLPLHKLIRMYMQIVRLPAVVFELQ